MAWGMEAAAGAGAKAEEGPTEVDAGNEATAGEGAAARVQSSFTVSILGEAASILGVAASILVAKSILGLAGGVWGHGGETGRAARGTVGGSSCVREPNAA